eukprot:10173172-Karenia_brevis.AAC.1
MRKGGLTLVVISFGGAISEVERNGQWQHVATTFHAMRRESLLIDVAGFGAAISACEHDGRRQCAPLSFAGIRNK